jgi:Fic family protein
MLSALSRADQGVGRLDGVAQMLPNPDLFVAMYVRREAVLSSQIEGTRSTLEDVLTFELDARSPEVPKDVGEVVGYVRAMNYGLQRLDTLPLSLRLIREIHGELFQGAGPDKDPGEFRRTQNWIGVAGASLSDAMFVPPPPPDMHRALDSFERFLHERQASPALIHCGLAHAQFEMIHPFLDGNGRVGRLLITLLLCEREVLRRPLLYLSYYLRRHRAEYYERLTAIHESGDWEGWLKFFLRGVAETAEEAAHTGRRILELREGHRTLVQRGGLGANAARFLDLAFERPLLNVNLVKESLGVSYFTANKLVDQFEQIGLLEETTGWQRNRRYRYAPYLALFDETALPA